MYLSEIKKQASSYIQEKYKTAKLKLTDVSQAELLTEEATDGNPWGPDAKTMTRISEAAYDTDDYWRIVDIIHRRLRYVNYKEWRQAYKTLVLLEFLLTHGPEHMFEEFHGDAAVIGELGKMNYVDERGFNWGACMKQKSQKLLNLLRDECQLSEARSKALKISNEIKGFGNLIIVSPSGSASSTPSSSSSRASGTSSFGSFSCDDSPAWSKQDEPPVKNINEPSSYFKATFDKPHLDKIQQEDELEGVHLWDNPIEEEEEEEDGSLLDPNNKNSEGVKEDSPKSWSTRGLCSRLFGRTNQTREDQQTHLTSSVVYSDVAKESLKNKKMDRQLSLGF